MGEKQVKLTMKYIILYVNDFEKTMSFYKDILGLQIKMQQDTYVEFDTGVTTLSINTRKSVKEEIGLDVPELTSSTQTFEIAFVVEDVSATIEKLREQGVPIIKEPATKPWGQTVAYVADPDGHFIEICTLVE
ncbi:Lactoylglutathione lyase [Bacillus sp. B14905]|nr:Lactoylglutathione lyase [Bacillus sp. B14905]